MEDGWIKIFRRFLDWEWYSETNMVRLFLHLLLKANFGDKRWRGIVIKRGQLVTSLASLHAETGISNQTLRTCLDRLQRTGEINKQVTSQFTIITVCKYGDYQQVQEVNQQTTNNQATSDQQATNKQVTSNQQQHKNIRKKEDKNNITPSNEGESVDTDPSVEIDLKSVVDFFNKSVVECGSVLPKIKGATGKRVGYIKARIREFGLQAVYEVIAKATASDFLNGKNQRGWVASFDWIMLPTNFPKVLEGNYDNRINQIHNGSTNTNRGGFVDSRQAEREHLAAGVAATIARLAAEDDARQGAVREQSGVPY